MPPNGALLTDAYFSPLRPQCGAAKRERQRGTTRTLGNLSARKPPDCKVAPVGGQDLANVGAHGEQDDGRIGEVQGQRVGKAAERRYDLPALTGRGFLPRARSVCD